MTLSNRIKNSIKSEPKYHAILEVLRIAFEQGYESLELPKIRAAVGAASKEYPKGILSSTDVGILVRSLMGGTAYVDVGDDLVKLGVGGYLKTIRLPDGLPPNLEALTTQSGRKKSYNLITRDGAGFSASFPFDISRTQAAMAAYFVPKPEAGTTPVAVSQNL